VILDANFDRHATTIRLPIFTGSNVALDTFLAKCSFSADHYGWSATKSFSLEGRLRRASFGVAELVALGLLKG
jgi:hypothetical protein